MGLKARHQLHKDLFLRPVKFDFAEKVPGILHSYNSSVDTKHHGELEKPVYQ